MDGPITVLESGPGFTVAISAMPWGRVPYATDASGTQWVDLRGCPERVEALPAAQQSAGAARVLQRIAAAHPDLMSTRSACGPGAVDPSATTPQCCFAGHVEVTFGDAVRNADPQQLLDLATAVLAELHIAEQHFVVFEFVIEPLRSWFGHSRCHCLTIRTLGFGETAGAAHAAFEAAMASLADALPASVEPQPVSTRA